jgi:heptaprenylglyceryl phosphate synthase
MGEMIYKKEKVTDLTKIKPEEEMKYEIAKELGYLDKVMVSGWKSLTAKESGRIGGIMAKKKRENASRAVMQMKELGRES